jgi:enoyl-CoA hydratase/carnithine racemase
LPTPAELAGLAGQLELDLRPDGTPANPLVVLQLDDWRNAPPAQVQQAAALVADALPVTAGVLTGPPAACLEPLLRALTLTLTDQAAVDGQPREVVPVGDIPGGPGLDEALGWLRAAVERSPRAAVACGQLVRQTAVLDTGSALAAEAAAYSLLLGGPEFARWLGERDSVGRIRPRHRELPAEPVSISRDGGRLSIVLNDPARRNAFSARMRETLLDALLVGAADETVTSVELSGAGPAFCSGGDLDEFGTATDLVAAYLVRLSRAPWRVIDRMAAKVTVAVHGACVGAGTELAAYAGRVVAAEDAFFALPEVGMGLVPGAGGSVSVPRRAGRWRAAWLMLTGDRLPAATALRWGLVDEVTSLRAGRDAQDEDVGEGLGHFLDREMTARAHRQVGVVVHAEPGGDRQPGVEQPEVPGLHALLEHGLNRSLVPAPPLPEHLGVLAGQRGEVMQEHPDVVGEAKDDVEEFLTHHRQLLGRRSAREGHPVRAEHDLIHDPVVNGGEQLLLRADVVVERALADAVRLAELRGARGMIATLGEHLRGRVHDLVAAGLPLGAFALLVLHPGLRHRAALI